jgi:hypothetical protein
MCGFRDPSSSARLRASFTVGMPQCIFVDVDERSHFDEGGSEMTLFWMNIDIPTRNCRLHKDTCKWARGKYSTPLKGVGELRRDGGWLKFDTIASAQNFLEQNSKDAADMNSLSVSSASDIQAIQR